jgi:hypothetical protein
VGACAWDSVGGGMEMSSIFRQEAAKLEPAANTQAERPRGCNSKGALEALWRATGLEGVEETSIESRVPPRHHGGPALLVMQRCLLCGTC